VAADLLSGGFVFYTVADLAVTHGKVSKKEYARLWALKENDRSEAEAANRALLQHTREHGC
jgi:hypothetical protein